MEAWHQKNLFGKNFPFNVIITDIEQFPPHWHEAIEIIYVLGEKLSVGINNKVYSLFPGDILFIGMGDVHYFIPEGINSKRLIVQFEISVLDSFYNLLMDMKFTTPHINKNTLFKTKTDLYYNITMHLELIKQEYLNHSKFSPLVIKARLYDILSIILKDLPMESYSQVEKLKQLKKLERLEKVYEYVENNYKEQITLEEISNIANFSLYHFTRFFKEATGITFKEYLNSYKISKAYSLLINSSNTISEIAYECGFESIKTFNRLFKLYNGCSPTQLKKQYLRND